MKKKKMMNNNLLSITKEGWVFVLYSFVAFLVLGILDLEFLQFFSFVAILFFLFIFRDPQRQLQIHEKGSILSPVDGTIINIQEIDDETYSLKITIESTYFDVSILRTPFESKLVDINFVHGARLSKLSALNNKLNENVEFIFENNSSNKIKISHKNVLGFTEIKSNIYVGQKLTQGSKYGVMTKGITDIYLPKNAKSNLIIATEVKACESIIASLY